MTRSVKAINNTPKIVIETINPLFSKVYIII